MRILDRYILKSTVKIFVACVFSFLFLYVVIDLLANLEDLLKQQVTITLLLRYYLGSLPAMFVQVSPFACLLSTLYTLGKLNCDNEIIAMRSAGLSIFQIAKPIIVFGLLVSLFIFWISDRVVPQSAQDTQKIRMQMAQGKNRNKEKKNEPIDNLTMYGLKNRLFFINRFYPDTFTMEGITVLEHDQHQNITRKIVAAKGVYLDNIWKFFQCITYDFDNNGQVIQEPRYFEEEIMAISETPLDFLNQRQRPDSMNISQLEDYIWKFSKSGASTVIRKLKVDLYQRFTEPFTSFVIIILGIPFSLIMRRRATGLSSIGISILVGFLYYMLDAVSTALGTGGIIAPLLAASLSHITALSYGMYLIKHTP
jgi:lipopolysaccharide export system permease protein